MTSNCAPTGLIAVFIIGLVLMLPRTISAMPVLATPVVRRLGALARCPLGIVAQLAEENALGNPRRTSATAAALMIGLALVSMMTVFGAAASGTVDAIIHKNFRGDYVVRGSFGETMSPSVAAGARKVDGVASLTRLRDGQGSVNGHVGTVEGLSMLYPATGKDDAGQRAAARRRCSRVAQDSADARDSG